MRADAPQLCEEAEAEAHTHLCGVADHEDLGHQGRAPHDVKRRHRRFAGRAHLDLHALCGGVVRTRAIQVREVSRAC